MPEEQPPKWSVSMVEEPLLDLTDQELEELRVMPTTLKWRLDSLRTLNDLILHDSLAMGRLCGSPQPIKELCAISYNIAYVIERTQNLQRYVTDLIRIHEQKKKEKKEEAK